MGIVLLTSILITTIVYSAFSTQLQINGEAIVRTDNDIRITNVKILNQTNNAYETYNNKYTKETTSMFVTLPSNSSITYEVEITDKANTGYIVQSISEISNTNSNIDIDIGLNQYDLISANSTKKFNISFTNTTNEEQISTLVLKYHFLENRFIVTFDANGGSVDTLTKEVAYGSNYGELPTPVKDGYTFKGWNGKNLFNNFQIGVCLYHNLGTVEQSNHDCATSDFIELDFNNNDNYIVSGLTNKLRSYISYYDSNKNFIDRTDGNPHDQILLKKTNLPSTAIFFRIMQYYQSGESTSNIDILNNLLIQLEEGTEATEYEPYYITSDTKVVQNKSHTLKAIWEENE